MKRALALLFTLLLGCGGDNISRSDGHLVYEPDSLDFGRVFVGHPQELEVRLRNEGRGQLAVPIAVEAPFFASSNEVALGGGERATLRIRFEPPEPGEYEGTLRVGEGFVALAGSAEDAPTCADSNRCRTITFDPVEGCVEVRESDGTDCSDACTVGTCQEGVCVGAARDCDDDDACTVDACDPISGCVNYDDSAACELPAGSDPRCLAPACDPDEGCVVEPLPDDTPCGPRTCSSAFVCLIGVCTEVQTHGGACGEITPCRDEGVCVDDVCVQPPPRPLDPIWEEEAASDANLFFDGATDPLGNLYWAECSFSSCHLVSVTSAHGFGRFRKSIYAGGAERGPKGHVVVAGDRVVATVTPGRIEAFHTGDGTVAWSTPLLPADFEAPAGMGLFAEEVGPPVVGDSIVAVAFEIYGEEEDGTLRLLDGGIAAYGIGDGRLRWSSMGHGSVTGLVGDEAGNLIFTARAVDAAPTDGGLLVSFTNAGVPRWSQPVPYRPALATVGGYVQLASGEARNALDGSVRYGVKMMALTWPSRSGVLAGKRGYMLGVPLEDCEEGSCPVWVPHLLSYELANGGARWSVKLDSAQTSEPMLTQKQQLLLAAHRLDDESWLSEYNDEDPRAPNFKCQMPPGGRYDGAVSLYNGVYLAHDTRRQRISAFLLEGRQPAFQGWITSGGSLQRTSRPRK